MSLVSLLVSLLTNPLVILTLLLAFIYYLVSMPKPQPGIPPFMASSVPFLGHMHHLMKDPRNKMMEWSEKSEDKIFSFYMGNQLTVVLSRFDHLKDALVKQADYFTERPVKFIMKGVPFGFKGIMTGNGENWKENRTVAMSILRNMGMGKNVLAEKVIIELGIFLDNLSALKGEPYDIRNMTNNCISNVICALLVGERFDLDQPDFMSLLDDMNDLVICVGESIILGPYHWLRFFPGWPGSVGRRAQKIYDNIQKFFTKNFIRPVTGNLEKYSKEDSMLAAYLYEMHDRQSKRGVQGTYLDYENLHRIINNLFAAGTETTSTTIVWFVLYMMYYPEVMKKVQEEIDDVVGFERPVGLADKPKLNYFMATIMETQRLASIVPLSLQHICTKTTTVNGFNIPEGTRIMPHLDAVLLDPNTWKEPMVLRPERFLDKDGKVTNFEEWVPFSIGRRICMGEALARMELFLVIGGMAQRFNFLPEDPNNLPPRRGHFGVTVPPLDYKVRLIDRKDS